MINPGISQKPANHNCFPTSPWNLFNIGFINTIANAIIQMMRILSIIPYLSQILSTGIFWSFAEANNIAPIISPPPQNWITASCSPNNKYAKEITNELYTVSMRAEIPVPIIFREWRKRISASPIPKIPLTISRILSSLVTNPGLVKG